MSLGRKSDFLHRGILKRKRAINLLKLLVFRGRSRANWYPPHVLIDPSTACQLRCPFCIQGESDARRHLPREFMSFDSFEAILDKIKDYVLVIDLFNWGESLLNPDCIRMIKAASDNHIRVRISSNLSFPVTDEMAEQIVRSRLFRLFCSVDGPTQESYVQHRVRGKLHLVEEAIRKIVRKKKELNSRLPLLDYRMLAFEWNHHLVDEARTHSETLECDSFCVDSGRAVIDEKKAAWNIQDKKWDFSGNRFGNDPEKLEKAPAPCGFLYRSMTINANGRNLICCVNGLKADQHMSLLEHSLDEVWNAPEYLNSRAFTFGNSTDRTGVHNACKGCRTL